MSDSRIETYKHIMEVQKLLHVMIKELMDRAEKHDQTKIVSPEVEYMDKYNDTLSALTYNSPEYIENLRNMQPALDHHYAKNRHHPQHFPNGVNDMNIIDIVEMFVDWKAATLKHNDGNLTKSIHDNQKRYGLSDQLKQIFLNSLHLVEE